MLYVGDTSVWSFITRSADTLRVEEFGELFRNRKKDYEWMLKESSFFYEMGVWIWNLAAQTKDKDISKYEIYGDTVEGIVDWIFEKKNIYIDR